MKFLKDRMVDVIADGQLLVSFPQSVRTLFGPTRDESFIAEASEDLEDYLRGHPCPPDTEFEFIVREPTTDELERLF